MTHSLIENVIWATTFSGEVSLIAILFWRGRWREYPIFTALTGYEVCVTILLFSVSHFGSRHAYFLAYWITAFADYAFQVVLIVEIARAVLSPTGGWVRDAWRPFLVWSALGTALAAGLAFTIGASGAKGFDLWQVRVSVFTSLLTCELFLAMTAAANRLGLQWRSHIMAIGQGLTVWAAAALIGDLGHVILGWNHQFAAFDYLYEVAYLGVLIFWAVALWLPEKERAPLSPAMQDYLVALHRRVQYDPDRARSANKSL